MEHGWGFIKNETGRDLAAKVMKGILLPQANETQSSAAQIAESN